MFYKACFVDRNQSQPLGPTTRTWYVSLILMFKPKNMAAPLVVILCDDPVHVVHDRLTFYTPTVYHCA